MSISDILESYTSSISIYDYISKLNIKSGKSSEAIAYAESLKIIPQPPPITNPYTFITPINITPIICKMSLYCSKNQQNKGITKQTNNISKKMLQSKMIQYNGKYSIKYSSSNTDTIISIILSENIDSNKNLLLKLCYLQYMSYFTPLLSSYTNINLNSTVTKYSLNIMLNNILAQLTLDEYMRVFRLIQPQVIIDIWPPIKIATTYYVKTRTIDSIHNKRYFIFKNYTRDQILTPTYSYIFDLSDPSNLNTQLSFSTNKDEISYKYLVVNGRPGTAGSYMILTIPYDINTNMLYPFNILEQKAYYKYELWGYTLNGFYIQLEAVASKKITPNLTGNTLITSIEPFIIPSNYIATINTPPIILELPYSSILSVNNYYGLFINITDVNYDTPILFFKNNKYSLSIGVYYIYVPYIYACAILNNNQESCITYTGESFFINDTVKGTTADGSYNFVYGTIMITVISPFNPISLYTYNYGYLDAKNIIVYSNTSSVINRNNPPNIIKT